MSGSLQPEQVHQTAAKRGAVTRSQEAHTHPGASTSQVGLGEMVKGQRHGLAHSWRPQDTCTPPTPRSWPPALHPPPVGRWLCRQVTRPPWAPLPLSPSWLPPAPPLCPPPSGPAPPGSFLRRREWRARRAGPESPGCFVSFTPVPLPVCSWACSHAGSSLVLLRALGSQRQSEGCPEVPAGPTAALACLPAQGSGRGSSPCAVWVCARDAGGAAGHAREHRLCLEEGQ